MIKRVWYLCMNREILNIKEDKKISVIYLVYNFSYQIIEKKEKQIHISHRVPECFANPSEI